MLASGSRFILVFYRVDPSEVLIPKGFYAQALAELEGRKIYDYQTNENLPRYDPTTIANWREAFCDATEINGFEVGSHNG